MKTPIKKISVPLAAILVMGVLAGCELETPFKVYVTDDMTPLTRSTPLRNNSDLFSESQKTVSIFAAANETISFQVIIDADSSDLANLHIQFSDLNTPDGQKIAARSLQAYRMWPVPVESFPAWLLRLQTEPLYPGAFYDPLTSVDLPDIGQPFTLEKGQRLPLWIDLQIPKNAPEGNYTGTLTVQAGSRIKSSQSITLKLKVYEFVLPDAPVVAAIGGFDYREIFREFVREDGKPYVPPYLNHSRPPVREGLEYIRQMMRLARAHRLDLFERELRPLLKRDTFGNVRLDWEDYDAIVTPYLTGEAFEDGLGGFAWPMPFCSTWPDPALYDGEAQGKAYLNTVNDVIRLSREHFKDRPETLGKFFYWPWRGPVSQTGYDNFVTLSEQIRKEDADTPILSTLPPTPPEMTGWKAPENLLRLSRFFAPPAEYFAPTLARYLAGKEQPLIGEWLSPGRSPFLPSLGLVASPADIRSLAWFAVKYHCGGLFLPEVLNWSADVSPAQTSDASRLFYPGTVAGTQGVLPSVRLKRLRRGLQDAAYLRLLQARGRMGVAKALLDGMVRYAGIDAAGDHYLDARLDGWVAEGAAWRNVRLLMAEEIQNAIREGGNVLTETQRRILWEQFDQQTHCLRIEQVRARLEPVWKDEQETQRLKVAVLLDLYNEYSRVLNVLAHLSDLPVEWMETESEVMIPAVEPGQRKIVRLTAEGVPLSANTYGHFPLTVRLDVGGFPQRTEIVSVPFLQAGWVNQPPKIDGALDDWPMRSGNTAGEFRLLGKRGRIGQGLAQKQTLAFVLRDAENLYVAFRCEEPNPGGLFSRANNFVHYDELLASGEDLVELVLDPAQKTHHPQDLYRLIVKSSGATIGRRGVEASPPLGEVKPWDSGTRVAVGSQNNAWVVEMAIPLSAFGEAGKSPYWGVNFIRFAPERNEASSWSGAARYFYDPRNLGTLQLPTPP